MPPDNQPPIDPNDPALLAQMQGQAPQVNSNAISNLGPSPAEQAQSQPQPDPTQGGTGGQPGGLQEAMSNYAGWLLQKAQSLQQFSGGAGSRFKQGVAAAAAHQAGIPSQYESQLQNLGAQDQALRTAVGVQQTGLQGQMVTLPNGLTVPLALAKTLAPAMFRTQQSDINNQRNNDTKKLLAGYNEDGSVKPLTSLSIPQQLKAQASDALNRLNKAKTDALNADPNTGAGQLALSKLQISEQMARASLTKAAAQAGMENIAAQKFAKDYIDGMQDEDGNPVGVQQYKAINAGAGGTTAATRTMAETAPKVIDLANRVDSLTTQLGSRLGPGGSRLSEVMAGKVGAADPDFTKLRTDVGLLQTALMRMHVGARGGQQIMNHFKDLIDSGKQSPENLHAALGEIVSYAKDVAATGKPRGTGASSGGVVTLTDGGKSYKIPAALKASFLKDHPNAR